MMVATIVGTSDWLARMGTPGAVTFGALVAVSLLSIVALLLAILLLSRRRLQHDIREIVGTLEDLRAGHGRRSEVERQSPLLVVSDAVNRLAQDLQVVLSDAAETRERLSAVTQASGDSAVITTDLDGDVRTLNDGALALLGWKRDEVVSRSVATLFAADAYEKLLPKLTRRSLRDRGVQTRSELLRKDGSTLPVELTIRTLKREGSEPVGFLMVARDVTERLRGEQELRESEERYRALIEGLSEGVAIVRGGSMLFANSAFGRLCEIDRDELIGQPLRDRVATGDLLLVEEALRAVESGLSDSTSLRCGILGPERRPRASVSMRLTATIFSGERAVLLVADDETRRLRVEDELRRNESRLDAVLESASDGILLLTDRADGGVVQMTNRALGELLGIAPTLLLGETGPRLFRRLREIGGGHAELADLLERDELVGEESQVVALRGAIPREVEATVRPLRDATGRPFGRVLACRDLTAQRESERKLQQHAEKLQLSKVMLEQAYRRLNAANRELETRTDQLDALNQELRKLDEMKSDLLGNVSHELQTPLVSIRGFTEMILRERLGPINEEQRKGLRLSLKNIDRLISMIDNLLTLARPDEESKLRLESFALRGLVDEALGLLGDELQKKRIRLSVDLPSEPLAIQGDRDKLLQVLINLLNNAVKFNDPGGAVGLRASRSSDGLLDVEVSDTGIGIPSDALDRIFERHFRVPREGDEEPGSGIGLTIVQEILRLHGCRIAVQSEPGRGTIFRFQLPVATEASPVSEAPEQTQSDATQSDAAQSGAPKPQPRFRVIRPESED